MPKAKRVYIVGDFVFAKVKGYPPWPAKINEVGKNKYGVFFYGTKETAQCKSDELFPYLEYSYKFLNPRSMKRLDFQKAIDEIEVTMLQQPKVGPVIEIERCDDMIEGMQVKLETDIELPISPAEMPVDMRAEMNKIEKQLIDLDAQNREALQHMDAASQTSRELLQTIRNLKYREW